MRKALVASSALHATLLVLAVVGLPHLRPEIEPQPTIAVSLVEIGPVSQTPDVAPPPPKPEPPKAEVQPVPPPPPAPAPAPAEAAPPPPPEKTVTAPPKPEPLPPKPDPAPEKMALPAQPPKPKDQPKQDTKKPEPKKDQKKDDFADIENFLQNRLKTKPQQPTPQVDPKSKQTAMNAPIDPVAKPQTEPATRAAAIAPLGPTLSGSELDALRQVIKEKWNANCGLKGFSQMAAELAVQVLPDGTVTSVKVERAVGSGDNVALTAFVDSAIRAVNQASPLPIPKDKYAQFDRFIVAFTPKEADCM